jgi:RNA polymerase sigma factor (sigma-70 family)
MPDCGPSDAELLADWLDSQHDAAFHALVERYAGLVHMAAMRTCGDESLAAEASQLTFITLARKARFLVSRSSIAGWLHLTAVMQGKNLLRQHQRESRKLHLLRTHMEIHPQGQPADAWKRMQPVLDEALAALSSKDREALLLRFYRSLSVREIAAALGIATDAAQKRLDRATDRLRHQLARRGCEVGGLLSAAMVAGFTQDAQAAIPATSILASKAIAASAASGTSILTTILIIMTKKATIAAGAALFLAGAGAVALIKNTPDNSKDKDQVSGKPANTSGTGNFAPTDDAEARAARNRTRSAVKNPELAEKYGESRTNLSKHITGNVISLLEDTVEMGEMATTGALGGAFGGRNGFRMGLGRVGNDLKLTDEQQEKASAIYAEFQKRELAKSKEAIDRLKKDPTSLMQLMLASDAFARGEITEDEYKRLQTASGEDLGGVLSPLDERNFRGGRPLRDEAFLTEFKGILDPTQTETLQASLAEQAPKGETAANEGSITNLPTMELEKLDTTIESVKKLTTGVKTMMEGMGGLQDLGPLMEQQRQRREAEAGKTEAGKTE